MRRDSAASRADLFAVAMSGDSPDVVVAQSASDETEGQSSPDGHWVAFASNDSGRAEVFVQSFPEGQARTQVSIAGGSQIRWSADGREIFAIAPDGRMMAVSIEFTGSTPDVKLPVLLFQTHPAPTYSATSRSTPCRATAASCSTPPSKAPARRSSSR